ncbi:Imm53 family immunity protein [Priestia taiwanensis]|uniref:Imm53 family immunity protein n=1 Tax=Priestia taiwanensis TaxID=1347902 RepID=UPI00166903CA
MNDGTTNENKPFETIEQERTHEDWIHCKVENTIFYGYGGPMNLAELLQLFRGYCE